MTLQPMPADWAPPRKTFCCSSINPHLQSTGLPSGATIPQILSFARYATHVPSVWFQHESSHDYPTRNSSPYIIRVTRRAKGTEHIPGLATREFVPRNGEEGPSPKAFLELDEHDQLRLENFRYNFPGLKEVCVNSYPQYSDHWIEFECEKHPEFVWRCQIVAGYSIFPREEPSGGETTQPRSV